MISVQTLLLFKKETWISFCYCSSILLFVLLNGLMNIILGLTTGVGEYVMRGVSNYVCLSDESIIMKVILGFEIVLLGESYWNH
jgi:hypothetical protein